MLESAFWFLTTGRIRGSALCLSLDRPSLCAPFVFYQRGGATVAAEAAHDRALSRKPSNERMLTCSTLHRQLPYGSVNVNVAHVAREER